MNQLVETTIRQLIASTGATEEQALDIIDGWRRLFERLRLREDEQLREFEAIMRARLKSGQASLVAPKRITENLSGSR